MRNHIKSILKLALLLILLFLIEMSTLGCFWKPTPQLTSMDPNRGCNKEIVTVTLTGTKFDRKATVKLTMAGQADITAQVKFVSKTQLSATFDLNGKAVGMWDLVVSNTTPKMAKLVNAFMIDYPAPTVISVSPNQGPNNAPLSISSLVGTDFRYGIKVLLRKSDQPEIIASRAALFSDKELTCLFDLTSAIPGVYDLVVMNDDGKTGLLTNGFTVSLFTPEPASQLKEAALDTVVFNDETAATKEDTIDTEEPAADMDTVNSLESEEEVTLDEEEATEEEVVEDATESGEEVALDEEEATEEEVVEDTTESGEEAVVDESTETEETMLDLNQAYALQALINVLEKKGILTKDEVLEELENIKATMGENLEEDEAVDEGDAVDEDTADPQEVNPEENAE
jgi:hypothetical protein